MKLVNAGQASFPFAFHGYSACASYDRHYWCCPIPGVSLQTCTARTSACFAAPMTQEITLPWGALACRLLRNQRQRL